MRYCPIDVMWADVLTKPLQGQKFRDMQAFLQNCPWDYDDDIELNIDQLAWKSMNQQVKTVASSRECVDGHAKLRTKQQSQEPSQPRGQPPALRTKQQAQEPIQPCGQPPALRTKQRSQEPSRPRGQPPAKSPTRVSQVTWVPSQVIRIPQRIPPRIPPGCPRDPTKNRQRVGDDPQQFRK